jgi:hypothetical protein
LFAVSREAGSETVECPGETWRILFADRIAREAVTYCPECAERESVNRVIPRPRRETSCE